MLRRLHRLTSQRVGQFSLRQYHSYPDPDEVPKITQYESKRPHGFDKSKPEYCVDSIHRLDVPFPGVPPNFGLNSNDIPETKITTLPSGLTVATQDIPGLMSSFAFVVGSGSSYENSGPPSTVGGTHFSELLAFKSTKNRGAHELATEIEELGGIVQCISNRESIIYCVDVLRENLEPALDILADTVLNPAFLEEDLEETRMVVRLQQEELPSDLFSKDAVRLAAYNNSPLGNPHYCPLDHVDQVNEQTLQTFRNLFLRGGNCVVSGSGVEHESFVRLIESKFASLPFGTRNQCQSFRAPSSYTGGMVTNQRELKEPFLRLSLAFEMGGWKDSDLVVACVLQQLLGGGSSFSAGGPGKGMYSRLYTNVLNQFYWVESVEAFVDFYDESGLFGIDSSFPPTHAADMIKVLTEHLARLAVEEVTDEELSRAKNMLRSMMLTQLESRLVVCEDIARQVNTYGKRELPGEISLKIQQVTSKDILAFGRRLMKTASRPSVGVVGANIESVPTYEQIKRFTTGVWEELQKR